MKLLPILVATAVSARAVDREQHTLLVDQVSRPENETPAIGVHFTASYAVAAARFGNGTISDLARIEGDAEYINLMSRWMQLDTISCRERRRDNCNHTARSESNHGLLSRWKCNLRVNSRRLRNMIGLPANSNAATLSTFLSKVRLAIETELGTPITSIAPVMFEVGEEESRDFQDALDAVGLASTHDQTLVDTNAAFVGLGAGLCKDWTNRHMCSLEEKAMRPQDVLFLDFDDESFSASIQSIRSQDKHHPIGLPSHFNELGWMNLPVFEVPRAKFWALVHEAVVGVVGRMRSPPGRIVLMGKHGADEEFKSVVEAALWSSLEVDVGMMLQASNASDAGRIAARGAAELAWRSEYWRSESFDQEGSQIIEL